MQQIDVCRPDVHQRPEEDPMRMERHSHSESERADRDLLHNRRVNISEEARDKDICVKAWQPIVPKVQGRG